MSYAKLYYNIGIMSCENRSSSALFKRAEQLKRWHESDTNKESSVPGNKPKKIQFSLGCVFLAACAAGDKNEVLRLLEVGADIDTTNVDGLSALHQACIDDNLDMVEFLVEHGADVNKGDNEGWTPLHATASCGFISIAKYLIEQGADIAAVNNDGELAVDIAESDEMEDMLQQVLNERGIDCDDARNEEEKLMLSDAKEWLSSGYIKDIPHPKTGATALHVAAAKGYIKVMKLLIQAGADINSQDFDGWTPLHAAAHWGQREACEILVEHFCDMEMKNYVGQTAFDIADPDILKLLEDLRKKQRALQNERMNNDVCSKKTPSQTKRLSTTDKILIKEKDVPVDKENSGELVNEENSNVVVDVPKRESEIEPHSEVVVNSQQREIGNKSQLQNEDKTRSPSLPESLNKVPTTPVPNVSVKEGNNKINDSSQMPTWRRPISFRNMKANNPQFADKGVPTPVSSVVNSNEKPPEVVLRRTQSFEADEKFYRRYCELRAKINAGNSCSLFMPSSGSITHLPTRSASLKEKQRRGFSREDVTLTSRASQENFPSASSTATVTTVQSSVNVNITLPRDIVVSKDSTVVRSANRESQSAPATPNSGSSKLSPGNIFKNFFKSFVPPVRDEESETQRKAHAKRVRETRRSTQGVTLEEIKSAEQLVKKKQQQQQQLQQATQQLSSNSPVNENQFMLEDVRKNNKQHIDTTNAEHVFQRWSLSSPQQTESTDTTVTLPLRKQSRSIDESDQDKENTQDSKNVQATQAVIQRRRRPKRRSTGVVHLDVDDTDPEKHDTGAETADNVDDESGSGDRSGRSSRLVSSSSSIADDESPGSRVGTPSSVSENGEIDYKKLYEEAMVENEKLKEKIRKMEDAVENKDVFYPANSKGSLSEIEKRERRAMERKLSEMEEELKQVEQLRQENQRLKDENGALIRVISKLSK